MGSGALQCLDSGEADYSPVFIMLLMLTMQLGQLSFYSV